MRFHFPIFFIGVAVGFVFFASPVSAALPAPTIAADSNISGCGTYRTNPNYFIAAGFEPSYAPAYYGLGFSFQYDASSTSMAQSFRIYLKKPGDGSYGKIVTFNNPYSLVTSSPGSTLYDGSGWPSSWYLDYSNGCTGKFWHANSTAFSSPSTFPVGEYDAYIVAVDSYGTESAPSAIMKYFNLDRSTISSPIGAQTTLNPTFTWTVASGWPPSQNINYIPRVYTSSSLIWYPNVIVPSGYTTASKIYDGPALNPGQTYSFDIGIRDDYYYNGSPYISMGAGVQTFTVSNGSTNSPPPTPSSVSGTSTVTTGISNTYWISLYPDPNGDQVKAVFDWGDGSSYSETQFVSPASGGTTVYASHSWANAGTYYIRVKAKDSTGLESGWTSSFAVTVGTLDTQPPSAPSNLIAAKNSYNEVDLSWTASTDNVGVAGYKIYRSYNSAWNQIGQSNNSYYYDTTVSPSTSYYYYVTAYDAAGNNSASSSQLFLNTPANTSSSTTPSAPSSFSVSVSSDGISGLFRWTTNSTNQTGFRIYNRLYGESVWRRINPSGDFLTDNPNLNVSQTPLSYADYNVMSGTYEYKVNACNSYGCSADSNIATVTFTQSTFAATPTNLMATSSGSNVYLTWNNNASGIASNWIYLLDANRNVLSYIGNVSPTTNYFTHNGLAAGTYRYRVNACNSYGQCSLSSNQPLIVFGGGDNSPPSAPTGLVSTKNSYNEVDLSWTASTDNVGVAGYKIYRSYNSAWNQIGQSNNSYYYDTTVSPSTSYYYYVTAYDAAGNNSASSSQLFLNTPANTSSMASSTSSSATSTIPAVPSNLSYNLSDSGTRVNLNWTDNSTNETRFEIYRQPAGGSWSYIAQVGMSITSFSDSPTAGSYYYLVAACSGTVVNTNCSTGSNTILVTIQAPPSTPTSTSTNSMPPVTDIKVDGFDGSVSRTAPASYSLTWTTSRADSCNAAGNWGGSLPLAGTQSFSGITTIGQQTYGITCSNSVGSTSDYVYVNVLQASSSTSPVVNGSQAQVSVNAYDANNNILAGVSIHIFTEDFATNFGGMTGSDGIFNISVSPGTYYFEVFPPVGRTDLVAPPAAKFSVSGGETKNLTAVFAVAKKTIVGKVSFSSGAPVTDAQVGAYSSETNTWVTSFVDGSGNYSLSVGGGKWQVGIRPKDPTAAKWFWAGSFPEIEFTKDLSQETRIVNFVVQETAAKLVVFAKDQSNNIIPGVGVVVDTVSASGEASPSKPPAEFRKSDSAGRSEFFLVPGTYYIRAFLPPDSGFINPDERKIVLSSGDSPEITLVFRRPEVRDLVKVFGKTKLVGGNPVDAFVWAWSEKGDQANTRSDEKGDFIFSLAAGSRWHIGAGVEIDRVPYKSGEIIIDTSASPDLVELGLAKFSVEPLPPAASVSQPAAQQIIVQSQDGARVNLPPSASGASGNVRVEIVPTIEAPSGVAAKAVSTVYDIKVTDQSGNSVKSLAQKIEVSIPYDKEVLANQGVNEKSVSPSYLDESTGVWVGVDDYLVDKKKEVFLLRVDHLTRFALVAPADSTPPSPPTNISSSYDSSNAIVISWKDPAQDFSHARIYRSTERGLLGELLATNIISETFTDRSAAAGVVYYYTVRAVDAAGNETSNKNQVAVEAKELASLAEISKNLSLGSSGDDVKALQQFLLDEGVYSGSVTGYFGSLTKEAVIRFQEKYKNDVLAPAGLVSGNGYVGSLTRKKINAILFAKKGGALPPGQTTKAKILRDLSSGSNGDDVKTLQQILLDEGVYPSGLITGYFGSLTKEAVIRFQEKYKNEVLVPGGLQNGTGYVGKATRAKLNSLIK